MMQTDAERMSVQAHMATGASSSFWPPIVFESQPEIPVPIAATIVAKTTRVSVVVVANPAVWDMAATVQQMAQSLADLQQQVEDRPLISQAMIYDLGPAPYTLHQPLLVTIEEYPAEVIATLPEFTLYASAESPTRAIALLKQEIASTYAEYEGLGMERLGPPTRDHLLTMRQLIIQRHA